MNKLIHTANHRKTQPIDQKKEQMIVCSISTAKCTFKSVKLELIIYSDYNKRKNKEKNKQTKDSDSIEIQK